MHRHTAPVRDVIHNGRLHIELQTQLPTSPAYTAQAHEGVLSGNEAIKRDVSLLGANG